MNLPAYQKPELRLPKYEQHNLDFPFPNDIAAIFGWLHESCDRYLLDPDVNDPDPEDGFAYMFCFDLWLGQRHIELQFILSGPYSVWVGFMVDGETQRTVPGEYVNAVTLARRACEVIERFYEAAHQLCEGPMWVVSNIQHKDGLREQRKWLMEKFFILDACGDDGDGQTMYKFLPRRQCEGENALFVYLPDAYDEPGDPQQYAITDAPSGKNAA